MRVLKRAKIIFNNGFSTFDCVVRNVSATGALLTLAESAHMPKEFQIKIGDDPVRPARLVYRRTMFAGVRYSDIPGEDEEPGDGGRDTKLAGSPQIVTSQADYQPVAPGASMDIEKIRPVQLPLAVRVNLPWA
ncbi:hypothetical protein U0C82_15200 [Fulvimarina sp. 2208YS6-2-32]|uniref:PilZ domain-containing protein n=2 Tax=Fulvimarina uroteuthidis TaxID=3098149 RepID=A0ABU5I5W4_9HYPH|nr:hypothetical protein [Fulvimarina sp. 2208YS6-2-32]MDY8110487.1 hypothetical protein [Fulvimarina sp. 2208YS6-2-32]